MRCPFRECSESPGLLYPVATVGVSGIKFHRPHIDFQFVDQTEWKSHKLASGASMAAEVKVPG